MTVRVIKPQTAVAEVADVGVRHVIAQVSFVSLVSGCDR